MILRPLRHGCAGIPVHVAKAEVVVAVFDPARVIAGAVGLPEIPRVVPLAGLLHHLKHGDDFAGVCPEHQLGQSQPIVAVEAHDGLAVELVGDEHGLERGIGLGGVEMAGGLIEPSGKVARAVRRGTNVGLEPEAQVGDRRGGAGGGRRLRRCPLPAAYHQEDGGDENDPTDPAHLHGF